MKIDKGSIESRVKFGQLFSPKASTEFTALKERLQSSSLVEAVAILETFPNKENDYYKAIKNDFFKNIKKAAQAQSNDLVAWIISFRVALSRPGNPANQDFLFGLHEDQIKSIHRMLRSTRDYPKLAAEIKDLKRDFDKCLEAHTPLYSMLVDQTLLEQMKVGKQHIDKLAELIDLFDRIRKVDSKPLKEDFEKLKRKKLIDFLFS